MKLNNKGFALTSIIYMLIVLFLMILLLILANLAQRKAVLDKIKNDIKTNLNQGIPINTSELPYLNITTGIYYETLEETFNNVQEGTESTIKVLKNIEDVSTPNLASGKTANLDLNGFIVTMDKTITNEGTLTITGAGELTNSTSSNIANTITGTFTKSGTSTISNTASDRHIINNHGLATFSEGNVTAGYRAINNGTNGKIVVSGANISANNMAIYNTGKASTASEPSILISDGTITSSLKQGIQNASTGMVYMSGGVVTSNGANTYGIQNNSSGGTVIVTGGTINAAYRCIRNSTNSTLIIEGGTFSAVGVRENTYSTQALSLAGGTINISGGNFNVNKGSSSASSIVELENNTTTNVTITGGTFTSDGGGIAVNGAGTLEIGGTASITAVNNGISNAKTGTVTITGGTIISTGNAAVRNNSTGTINITGGTMRSTNHDTINLAAGTINMSAGTVISDSNAGFGVSGGTLNISDGSVSGKTYGVALTKSAATVNVTGGTIVASGGEGIGTYGTLTLGIDETTTSGITSVNTTTPSITGSTYGVRVYSGGILNFYDGVVVGQNGNGSAISGTVVTPNGYTKKTVLDGTTETATLGWATDSNDNLIVNDTTEYNVSRTSSDAANKVIKQYTINAPFSANEVYQVEADIKGSGELYIYFYGASGYWQVQQVQPLYPIIDTGTNDGRNRIALPSEYTHYESRFTLKPTGNADINKYLLFRLNWGDADAYVKNIKFYKIN